MGRPARSQGDDREAPPSLSPIVARGSSSGPAGALTGLPELIAPPGPRRTCSPPSERGSRVSGSPSRARTYNPAVNSRMLYH